MFSAVQKLRNYEVIEYFRKYVHRLKEFILRDMHQWRLLSVSGYLELPFGPQFSSNSE